MPGARLVAAREDKRPLPLTVPQQAGWQIPVGVTAATDASATASTAVASGQR